MRWDVANIKNERERERGRGRKSRVGVVRLSDRVLRALSCSQQSGH